MSQGAYYIRWKESHYLLNQVALCVGKSISYTTEVNNSLHLLKITEYIENSAEHDQTTGMCNMANTVAYSRLKVK